MPIQQYIPTFGRMKVPSVDDYDLLVKELSRFVKSDFVMKRVTEFESDGYLRYHALTKHHIVREVGFDAAFSGSLGDARHGRITDVVDGLDYYLWCRSYYWRDEGMIMNIDLDQGSRRRNWDVWFKLQSIVKDQIDRNLWKSCWETAASSFGFANLVHSVDVDGLNMPDLRPETPRLRNEKDRSIHRVLRCSLLLIAIMLIASSRGFAQTALPMHPRR